MESTIRLKSYILDIFEFLEQELTMYEYSFTQSIAYYVPQESTPLSERTYLNLNLRQDPEKAMLYKREEYDLLTYFGDLGGLLSSLLFSGWTISSMFVLRLFHAALVKKIYRV